MTIRVMIVDDHTVFRQGLRAVLDGRDGVIISAEAGTTEDALECASAIPVDVILMDLHLPGADGLAATRSIVAKWPERKVLVLSMLDDRFHVAEALAAGAAGYLVKSSSLEEIVRAVHAVHSGQLIVSREVAAYVHPTADTTGHLPALFTAREREVLALLARGATTAQIAATLRISTKTVRNYLSTLYAKLDVEDRGQAALAAADLFRGPAG